MIINRKGIAEAFFWLILVGVWLAMGYAFFTWVVEPGLDIIAFEYQGRNVEILAPLFFGVLLVLPVLWLVQRFTLSDLPRAQRWINVVVRALFIVALTGALVEVVLTSFESRVSTIFLIDASASMPDEALDEAVDYVNAAIEARGERDEVKVLAFAGHPYRVDLDEEGRLPGIERAEGDDALQTDPAAALRMAYGLFPQDQIKRAVVISDGNETRGDFLAEAHRASAFGIRLYNKETELEMRPEVLIREVEVPDDIKVGETFKLSAKVFSTHADEATFVLWQNDFKDATRRVELEAGDNEITFETVVSKPGFKEFKLEMSVAGEDHFAANNDFTYSKNVRGKPRVLYIEGEMRSRHYLQRALREENFDLETRGVHGLPSSLEEFESFDLVLVSDLPARHMTTTQMHLIDRYVSELGGGFIMAGGESSFGPGGYYGTDLEQVLPVNFEPKKKRETPSLALLLAIDKSGSMSGDRIELAKDASKAAVELLQREDKVGVLAFDHTIEELVRMQSAANRVRILSDISRLRASGGTDIALAMQHAYEELALTPAKLKHIILLTDGISDRGNIFSEIVPAMRIEGITVSTVAIGNQAESVMLKQIAEGGGGRFYHTSNPHNVPRIFVQETSTVSRTSMVEEPFRPRIATRAQVLNGIPWDSAPFLLGYVSTRAKDRAEVLMTSDYGEPILARWRHGLGKSVAFTSDLKNRWAVQWVRWPGYAKFWAQLIRDTMRTDDRMNLAMRTDVHQGEARIIVDAIGQDDRFINDLQSSVMMRTPSGDTKAVDLTQTAAGRYEARVPLTEYGSYSLQAQHDKDGDAIGVSLASLSYPYPRELLFLEPNREVLQRAAEIGNGSTDPPVETLFDPMGEEVKYRAELWPYFLMVALGLLLLDLALRRIRLWGSTDLEWEKFFG